MIVAMPAQFSFGTPELSASGARPSPQRTDESPFRILLPGDFSGRESRGVMEAVRGRKTRPADLDQLDATLARIAPRLDLELPRGGKIALQSNKLDDFHPDRIWQVEAGKLPGKAQNTPFDGRALEGTVLGTWKAGRRVFVRVGG